MWRNLLMSKKREPKANKERDYKPQHLFGVGREKQYLAENLSSLVASGVTILDALNALLSDIKNHAMKRVIESIIHNIQNGSPVWKAFEREGIFNDHVIALVRVGEETGRLSDNLKVVAQEEKKSREFRSKVRAAMMYPVFVVTLTLIIGIAISWFILPRLATVFTQLNTELPLLTRIIISFGEFLQAHGIYVIPSVIVGLILIFFVLFGLKQTKFIGQWILFHIPGVKGLLRNIEVARFGFLFGTLLNVGIPISQAVSAMIQVTHSRPYKKFYVHLEKKIMQGASMREVFNSYPDTNTLFPRSVQQIILSGEQSGNLSEALLTVGETAEQKTEDATKNLSVILEPILLVVVWLGVLVVALGVLMPIYSLTGGLTGRGFGG